MLALATTLGLVGCSGSGSVTVTTTATVTASPSEVSGGDQSVAPQSTSASPAPSETSASSEAWPGEKASYGEIKRRWASVFRAADDLATAPTLPQTREAWDHFYDAAMQFADLVVMDFSDAGGSEVRSRVAEFAEATVVFANYHSQLIDDRAYCETQGDKAAQQACMRRLSDPNDWGKSFQDLIDAGRKVADLLPG